MHSCWDVNILCLKEYLLTTNKKLFENCTFRYLNSFHYSSIDGCVHYLGVLCFKQPTESLGQENTFACGISDWIRM